MTAATMPTSPKRSPLTPLAEAPEVASTTPLAAVLVADPDPDVALALVAVGVKPAVLVKVSITLT